MRVMVIFGTRPEAIKMAPVIRALREHQNVQVQVVVTAQHRHMLDQVLDLFGVTPDADLDIMREAQSLPDLTARILRGITPVLVSMRPNLVLVHGDTTTALASALSAFYARIPVAHVEAGLRTGDPLSPWPEEVNRRLVSQLCAVHFAPTARARDNLLAEGTPPRSVHVTGNTVIDALLHVDALINEDSSLRTRIEGTFSFLSPHKRLLLVTGHRRENFGPGLEHICRAIARLAERDDVEVVYPVHLNPKVQQAVRPVLSGRANIHLIEPQDYLPFVYLMRRSELILTDSGGVQEEAPSLGKPVLLMRENTERPEAVDAGTVVMVGTDDDAIVDTANDLLDDPRAYSRMSMAHNPYGDGKAAGRIANIVAGL